MLSVVSVEQDREYFVSRAADYISQRENALAKFIIGTRNLHDATVDFTGAKLLHLAAAAGNVEVTNYLLGLGANVDARDQFGYTPLIKVLQNEADENIRVEDTSIIEILLLAGSNYCLKNDLDVSALQLALNLRTTNVGRRTLDIIKLFLGRVKNDCENDGARMAKILMDNDGSLERAMLANNADLTRAMIARGCPVDQRQSETGTTALHAAVNLMSLGNVEALIEHGANVLAENEHGLTPLQYYCKTDYYNEAAKDNEEPEIVRIMMRSIKDVNKRSRGRFIVETVAARGSEKAVKILLEYNLDFYAQNSFKKSLLYHFAGNPIPHVMKLLKTTKIYLTFRRTESSSMLGPAVMYSNRGTVEFLLANGADPNVTTGVRETPILIVALRTFTTRPTTRSLQCLALLLENGASVQCEYHAGDGVKTVFELDLRSIYIEKLLIQYLAIEEVSGKFIMEKIRKSVASSKELKPLFNKCVEHLQELNTVFVYDSSCKPVTFFTLLSENEETIIRRFAYNSKFLKNLEDQSKKEGQLSFYEKLVRKRIMRMIPRIKAIVRASEIVSCLMSAKKRMDDIVVWEVVSYLDYYDMEIIKKTEEK